jgi:hypothetical protein
MLFLEILPFIVGLAISGCAAIVLVLLEERLVARTAGPGEARRFSYWGTAAYLLLGMGLLAAIWMHFAPESGAAQLASLVALFVLTPVLLVCLVFLLANWRALAAMGARSLPFLLPLAALLALLAIFIPGLVAMLLVVSVLLALLWRIPVRVVDWLSGAALLGLAFQKVSQPDLSIADGLASSAAKFGIAGNFVLAILMLLPYLLPALLVYHSLKAAGRPNWTSSAPRLGLAGALALLSAWDIGEAAFWASAQSRFAQDNFPFQTILPVLFGLLLALFLSGWRRLAGALYGMLVSALLVATFVVGWNVSNTAVTEGRARRIENALASYYQHNGRYPDRLEQLTPAYLLFNLPPAGNDLDRSWCYLSGPQAYRLGYIAVQFGVPYQMPDVSVAIVQQAGELPSAGWDCDQKAQAIKDIYAAQYR